MRIAALTSALLLLACAGCASKPSEPRTQYLLRSAPVESSLRVQAPLRVGLKRVSVAPYLDQAGLVVEVREGQLRAARTHQWAEPLAEGLRSYLRSEISAALGYPVALTPSEKFPWDIELEVYVDRLHGDMQGQAVIDAGYRVMRPATDQIAEYRFSRSTHLPREGYEGLFQAEADLARQLAEAIAAAIDEMTTGADAS